MVLANSIVDSTVIVVRARVAFKIWVLLSERHVLKWRGRWYVAVSASIMADQIANQILLELVS